MSVLQFGNLGLERPRWRTVSLVATAIHGSRGLGMLGRCRLSWQEGQVYCSLEENCEGCLLGSHPSLESCANP